jgi:hypothetical protein
LQFVLIFFLSSLPLSGATNIPITTPAAAAPTMPNNTFVVVVILNSFKLWNDLYISKKDAAGREGLDRGK